MAGGTGYVACSMSASGPVNEFSTLVAAGTDFVVTFYIVLSLLAKREGWTRPFLLAFGLVDVSFAFTMAAGTVWQAAIHPSAVTRFPNTENWVAFILIMASSAFRIPLENDAFFTFSF